MRVILLLCWPHSSCARYSRNALFSALPPRGGGATNPGTIIRHLARISASCRHSTRPVLSEAVAGIFRFRDRCVPLNTGLPDHVNVLWLIVAAPHVDYDRFTSRFSRRRKSDRKAHRQPAETNGEIPDRGKWPGLAAAGANVERTGTWLLTVALRYMTGNSMRGIITQLRHTRNDQQEKRHPEGLQSKHREVGSPADANVSLSR